MTQSIDIALLIGRVLFGGFFAMMGINHLTDREAMTAYTKSQGIPAPGLAVIGTGLLLLAGGVSVILGFLPEVGLALIALFLVGVTPTMHAFWKVQDPQQRAGEQTNFMKNVALLGAALALLAVSTPWALSI